MHNFFTFTLNPRKNQTMKRSIPLNLRPLLRAFYAFRIAIAPAALQFSTLAIGFFWLTLPLRAQFAYVANY